MRERWCLFFFLANGRNNVDIVMMKACDLPSQATQIVVVPDKSRINYAKLDILVNTLIANILSMAVHVQTYVLNTHLHCLLHKMITIQHPRKPSTTERVPYLRWIALTLHVREWWMYSESQSQSSKMNTYQRLNFLNLKAKTTQGHSLRKRFLVSYALLLRLCLMKKVPHCLVIETALRST